MSPCPSSVTAPNIGFSYDSDGGKYIAASSSVSSDQVHLFQLDDATGQCQLTTYPNTAHRVFTNLEVFYGTIFSYIPSATPTYLDAYSLDGAYQFNFPLSNTITEITNYRSVFLKSGYPSEDVAFVAHSGHLVEAFDTYDNEIIASYTVPSTSVSITQYRIQKDGLGWHPAK